jgi:hypothetical protein
VLDDDLVEAAGRGATDRLLEGAGGSGGETTNE